MNSWVSRSLLPVAGAVFGAELIGVLEAVRIRNEVQAPMGDLAGGDAAALVPLATLLGLVVAGGAMLLNPRRSRTVSAVLLAIPLLKAKARARAAAAALMVPPAVMAWLLISARGARAALAHGGPTAAGVEMASVSIVGLWCLAAAVLAGLPIIARRITAGVGPLTAGACGVSFTLACLAIGVRIGDPSGEGPTPLSILGVLARPELDLSPVLALMAITAFAVTGVVASKHGTWDRVVISGVVISMAWALVVREAFALSDAPGIARAIELGAPLGRVGLALARRATDRDGDGYSALFGGGDCDDSDPRRSPTAVEIPGNGIDEDCSGADLPMPRPAPPPPPPSPRAAVPPDLNLVLITVDTLRIDLGFMGYDRPVSPNLDALAARSTVFDRAYSMASYTGRSVGPTLIGKYPSECDRDGAHFATYGPSNVFLAERLQDAGFHTMGVASHWYFKPKYGLAQGMDIWDLSALRSDAEGDADASVTSDLLSDTAISLLSEPSNVDKRFFLWIHYFDPHAPYVPHPEAPDFRAGAKSWGKPLYDGEVWFTDRHIGRLLDFIDTQPWGPRTAIVLTSDHGEAFDEHGMNWHGVDLWEPLVRVPLVIYVPGAKPHRIHAKRGLIDVAPTVLDLMGLPAPQPGEMSGQSCANEILDPEGSPPEERDVFLDMPTGPRVSKHQAIIHGPTPGQKLLHEGGPVYLVFDLSSDPGELNDLSRSRPVVEEMFEAYQEKLATLHEVRVDPTL